MCHISIIYSVYVYHIFGSISMIGHVAWDVSLVHKIKATKNREYDELIEIHTHTRKIKQNLVETNISNLLRNKSSFAMVKEKIEDNVYRDTSVWRSQKMPTHNSIQMWIVSRQFDHICTW